MGGDFQFKIVVEPMPELHHIERLFELPGEPTAECAPRQNVGIVWCTGSTATLARAVVDAIAEVELLGLRAVRVEAQPWLTVDDIARRLGRSREAVRQWADGEQGPGGFPPPLSTPRDGASALRAWPQVAAWLRGQLGYQLPDDQVVVAAASLALHLRALAPQVPGMRALRRLLAP